MDVKYAAIEKNLIRMRLDKKTFAAMDEPEVNAAMHCAVIPRHPQILIGDLEAVNLIVPQAIVLRQNDFDGIATRLQLAAQTIHDISETADFGDRRALRRYHDYVHFPALNLSATRESGK